VQNYATLLNAGQNYNAVTNTPQNTNFLTQPAYKLYVKKAQHVNFFTQDVKIPGMELPPTHQSTPLVNIPYWGDHMKYEPLDVEFIVDSEMLSYFELHYWLRGMGHPATYYEYRRLMNVPLVTGEGLTSDIGIHVLSSTEQPKYEFVFRDAFPVSLTGFHAVSTKDDITYVTVSASFRYTLFDVRVVNSVWG
jgi:hypothetical protein